MNEILEAALEYKKMGFNVMPLVPNNKNPLLQTWKKYENVKVTEEQIIKWFSTSKQNIGIITGEISGNLEVLDLDHESLLKFFANIKTYQTKTQSGGYHLYFKVNTLYKTATRFEGYNIDVRSHGGFAVAPPSTRNGKTWEVAREGPIMEIDNLEDFIRQRLPKNAKRTPREKQFKGKISAYDIISKYRKLEPAGAIWQGICPFHEDHTPSFFVYYQNYHCFGCGAHGDFIQFIEKYTKCDRKTAIKEIEKITGKKFGLETSKTSSKELEKYARKLIENWHLKTLESDKIVMYKNGVYVEAENSITKELTDEYGLEFTIKRQNILTLIQDSTKINSEDFDTNPNIVNLKNGLYDFEKYELIKHTPEYLSLLQIPVEYHENAKCPLTEKFISEITDKNRQQTLWELLGYCLYQEKITQQFFILYGNGANGKTVYMGILSNLLGEENTSRLTFEEIEASRFALAELQNKLLNVSSEAIVAKIKTIEQLKRFTGEYGLEGELKFVQKRIKFIPKATFVFGTNEILALDDPKYAETRRLIFVHFPKQFKGKNKDSHILQKLTTKEEQEGQLLKGFEHLQNVLKNNTVYDPLNEAQKENLLEKGSDQINEFLSEEFDWDLESAATQVWIEGKCLYEMLEQYCKKNCLVTPSNRRFKKLLKIEHRKKFDAYNNKLDIDNLHTARKKIDGKNLHTWKLVPLKKPTFVIEKKNSDDLTLWTLSGSPLG